MRTMLFLVFNLFKLHKFRTINAGHYFWLFCIDGLTAANDEPENDEGWYSNNKPVIKTGFQLYYSVRSKGGY